MWVLLEHSNRRSAGELDILKVQDDPGRLRALAARIYAEWLSDRQRGIRAGGAQLLLAPAEKVTVADTGIILEWADCECLADDMLGYVDWCDAHGLSIVEVTGAAFH